MLEDDTELFSCDFEGLYTNIESNDAIHRITEFVSRIFKNEHLDNYAIFIFLKIIFANNVFEFEGKFYVQIKGLAMGCKCGPSIANLYLFLIEKSWLCIHRPLVYLRFIDDIFIANKGKLNTNEFASHFGYLKLNIVNEKKVTFLDLNISVNKLRKNFEFDLFVKPTNTFQYLHNSSNHPKHIFLNIPKSLFIRIKRICSEKIDFLYHSRNLIVQLLKRGYDYDFLLRIFNVVNKLNRNDLLGYKDKFTKKSQNEIKICMSYDHNYLSLNKVLMDNFLALKDSYSWLNNFNISFINSIQPNLKQLIIDNYKYRFNQIYFSKNCKQPNCKVCDYLYNVSHLKLNKFILPMKSNCNCKSTEIVYIIKCLKCNVFYIGESGFTAERRISEHLHDIRTFVPYGLRSFMLSNKEIFSPRPSVKRLNRVPSYKICTLRPVKKITEVAEHFNLKGHSAFRDFKFCIFDKNLGDREIRLSIETDIMNIIRDFNHIINIKIPNFKFINNLSFSFKN